MGNYIWNVYACYSNATYSNCSSATNNYSFSVGMSVINATYNSSTFPTARETFLLQGIKNIITPSINASLVYNGTSYPSTVIISGQNVNITNSIDIPSSSFGNVSFYWIITSFGTLGSITQNSTTYYQTVQNF